MSRNPPLIFRLPGFLWYIIILCVLFTILMQYCFYGNIWMCVSGVDYSLPWNRMSLNIGASKLFFFMWLLYDDWQKNWMIWNTYVSRRFTRLLHVSFELYNYFRLSSENEGYRKKNRHRLSILSKSFDINSHSNWQIPCTYIFGCLYLTYSL